MFEGEERKEKELWGRERAAMIVRSPSSPSVRIRCCAADGLVCVCVCVWVYFLGSGSRLSKERASEERRKGRSEEEEEGAG